MMKEMRKVKRSALAGAVVAVAVVLSVGVLLAMSPQIPNVFLNNKTLLKGSGMVHIAARADMLHGGNFYIRTSASSAPPSYPAGIVSMKIDMSDSLITYFESTTVEELSSTGKHTPTAYMAGKCKVESDNERPFEGCRYWVLLSDNLRGMSERGTPDIVSFLVVDGNGKRLAYGTGPVVEGDVYVEPTAE